MQLSLYHIDTFTDAIFSGNSACVVPLASWLPEPLLLNIARENAVAETAFFVEEEGGIHLRWFTPEIEMDLCGHATLATAHAMIAHLGYAEPMIRFQTLSGELTVSAENGLYWLDLPARKPAPAELPDIIRRSLNIQPREVLKARDYVLVYDCEADIRSLTIDRQVFDQINLDPGGVVVTAPGDNADFVSRYFTPQASILEDPVTGSSHCSLVPFWSERLGKKDLFALQVSARLGKLFCMDCGDRVKVGGHAVTYFTGILHTAL